MKRRMYVGYNNTDWSVMKIAMFEVLICQYSDKWMS